MTRRAERRPVALVALADPREGERVQDALRRRFDVVPCEDAARFLAAFAPAGPPGSPPAARRPDLVVTAARLPLAGSGGPTLDAMLELRQRDPFLPTIVLIDPGDESARASATARGALAVVERPVDPEVIASWAAVARACFAPEPIDLLSPNPIRPRPDVPAPGVPEVRPPRLARREPR
jgi:DNA-binding NarL/FixJ family response regulator